VGIRKVLANLEEPSPEHEFRYTSFQESFQDIAEAISCAGNTYGKIFFFWDGRVRWLVSW